WFVLRQFLQAPPDRAWGHASGHRDRCNPTITHSKCLRRRDQPTSAFVEKRRYCGKPLSDGFNIDHHHNIWCGNSVVNPYLTLSKVDSIISGRALSVAYDGRSARFRAVRNRRVETFDGAHCDSHRNNEENR